MKQFSKDLGNVSLAPKGKWSREQEYERLALVYNACDNLSYVAKTNVPSGIDIENREYWQPMNVTGYADNNFINLTTENENGTITAYETLEEAVATIVPINRRAGATLSFYNLNSDRLDRQAEFELWQFNSTDLANWENRDYWNNVYYNWNVFVGWYIGADALKNHVKLPTVGQYAYVGSNLNDALLYQCRTNGAWTNTGIKVRNYISVVVSGNIIIGENGNWFSDGIDTGIPATPAVDEQLDNIIIQLQQHTTEIDKLQKQDVTLKSNIDSNFETINDKVDNIKTATDNKIDTADANLQNQITSNDNDIAALNTKHENLSRTVQGIVATGGASTATNVTYNNDSSGLNAENAQDAIDELQTSKIDKTSILQKSGESEDKVMSQKVVSDKLRDISNKTNLVIGTIYSQILYPITYPSSSIETGYYYNDKGQKIQNSEYSVTQAITFQDKDTLYIELPNGGEFGGGALIFENSEGQQIFTITGQDKGTVQLINKNIYAITRRANASQVKLSISGLDGKTFSYGYSMNGKVNDIISDETKAKIEQGILSYQLLSPYIYSHILSPTTYPSSSIETGYFYNNVGEKVQNNEYSITQAISFQGKDILYIELPNGGEFGGGALIFENSRGDLLFASNGQDKDTVRLINGNIYAITRRANAVQVKLSISNLRGKTFSYGYSLEYNLRNVAKKSTYYIKDISCTNTDEIQIGETTYIKSNIKLSTLFVFENFNGQIKISKGSNKFYYTDNIVVDAENVAIRKNKKPHNLNIRDYLQIDIDVAFDSTAEITLSTNGGEAKFQSDLFYGDGPMFVSAFNGCTIVNANIQFKSLNNILPRFYGDSYSSSDRATSKTRWVAQAFIRGCRFFVNGLSGGKSVDMIKQFYQDIKICDNPKMVIWGLGMNDGSDSANAPSSNWKNYIDNIINYSKANEIELILCTIPSVPNINHEQKNKYVRNSGLRYIDFAKAVENGEDNTWKSGMLSTDNVHPTELGAIALYMQAISDVPELFGN